MDRRRLAMAGVVAVSMGVGAVAGAVVFTPGVGLAASDTGVGFGAAAAVCADALGPLGASPIDTASEAIVHGELPSAQVPHPVPGFGPGTHGEGSLLPPLPGGAWGAGAAEASVH